MAKTKEGEKAGFATMSTGGTAFTCSVISVNTTNVEL